MKTNNYKLVLGFPGSKVHPIAEKAFADYFPYQSNNIGVHTYDDEKQGNSLTPSKMMEAKCIAFWSDLLGAKAIDGYISAGGTENNLMGLWVARNKLRKEKKEGKTVVLRTQLSHYSLEKGTDLLCLDHLHDVPLNANWSMDATHLANDVDHLSAQGYTKFIVVVTIGNTVTGTVDDVAEISSVLKKLKEDRKDLRFYLHIDGAIGGYIIPFIDQESGRFFMHEEVDSMGLNSHKMGLTPYPGGIFLCRKGLLENVERPVKILESMDRTLLGSRSGASAVAIYQMLMTWGVEGYRKNALQCIELKDYLMQQILELLPNSVVKTSAHSNMMGICFKDLQNQTLPAVLENSYCLLGTNTTTLGMEDINKMYSFVVMPSTSKSDIDSFLAEFKIELQSVALDAEAAS
ncbi:MAG: pyridoxal-dependent decarboxylase [Flavobacteriales bacterium]